MKRQKRLPILKTPGHRAQNPRFCARNARKLGFRKPKKYKNPDFVLEIPENRGSEAKKRTKTPILCSKCPKMGVSEAKKAQKPRFCAREEGDWQWEEMILASGSATVAFLQITARTNPCSRHLWGTLARALASICAHRARLRKLIIWL